MQALLRCTKCSGALPLAVCNAEELVACPQCGSQSSALVFPALLERLKAVSAEAIVDDAESSCFYHPAKKATAACENCGRFICALCEVDLSGALLCPQCLDSGKRKGKLTSLESSRTLYDNLALTLSLLGVLVVTAGFTVLSAPIAVYICLRYRNAPRSLVRPGRWKWWVALILSVLQIVGWGIFLSTMLPDFNRSHNRSSLPAAHPATQPRSGN